MGAGSSPRVWGIPTAIPLNSALQTVHPHGCGEYGALESFLCALVGSSPRVWGIRFMSPLAALISGSSPRVWGIRRSSKSHSRGRRFIPTGVGNTCIRASSIFIFAVHPHGCGEYAPTKANISVAAVHPHGCGEYDVLAVASLAWSGSSPRVWGIPCSPTSKSVLLRFIPTGVGNTQLPFAQLLQMTVHPHGCGEYVHFFPVQF